MLFHYLLIRKRLNKLNSNVILDSFNRINVAMNTIVNIKKIDLQLDNQQLLIIENLSLTQGNSLLICGDNASGKSLLGQLIKGPLNFPIKGTVDIIRPENIELVSFTTENDILSVDRDNDDSEHIEGGIDWGRNAGEIIGNSDLASTVIKMLNIEHLIDRPFKVLSTGQVRKVLLAKAIAAQPQLLILDEPYAGLDITSQKLLTQTLNRLIEQGQSLIIIDFYHLELPKNLHQLLLLSQGKVTIHGDQKQVLNSDIWKRHNTINIKLPHHLPDCHHYDHLAPKQAFAVLSDVRVKYENNLIFENLNWQFLPGQHWRFVGPNGCGKSTLLSLINGDNPKAYGQDITLFGRKRGSGETIWDIKRHYGLVSAQFHRDYRASTNVLETIVSGFFDSIGLYDAPTKTQTEVAHQWLDLLELTPLAKQPFSQLSYGEQRLVLIARAVVKLPLILILDEPCLGLDNHHRAQVLALIDYITRHSGTHVLFVSHDSRDQLNCLTHQLEFIATNDGFKIKQHTLT